MEQNPTTDAAILNFQDDTNLPQQHTSDQPQNKKKLRSAMNIVKVAIIMMRRPSSKSKGPAVHGGSRRIWDKLLCSMRPLHLEGNQSSPPSQIQSNNKKDAPQLLAFPSPDHRSEEALFTAMQSPEATASCLEGSSNYSSALSLSKLDQSNGEDKITGGDDRDGDEMIDAKAEEFIAQFYEQMTQQRMDHLKRRQNAI